MALLVSLFFPADYKWNYEFDEEIGYHHLCCTKGWKDFQERRDRKAAELGKDLKLITVIPYLDEYEHHQSRHESYLAIYITLGNIPVTVRKWQMRAQCGLELGRADPILQEMKKAKNRHLVAAVPSKLVDLFEVIQHVLVNPALELEGGYEAEYSLLRETRLERSTLLDRSFRSRAIIKGKRRFLACSVPLQCMRVAIQHVPEASSGRVLSTGRMKEGKCRGETLTKVSS